MKLTIVLPVWNEAKNLSLLLPELKRIADTLQATYEILVVDGGSADGSQDVARQHGVSVITQERPRLRRSTSCRILGRPG